MTLFVPPSSATWDESRNTSRQQPVPAGALEEALRACAELRRRDPALCKWLTDGHPTLTVAEHYERFGEHYTRRPRRAT